jgi:hypothetical protein
MKDNQKNYSEKLRFVLALLTAAMLVITSVTASAAASLSAPSDVEGRTYAEAVAALTEKDIITGDSDGLFHPDQPLTRAQVCVIIVRAMNPPVSFVNGAASQSARRSGFSDMLGYGWAEGYVSYAVEKKVTNGYPDGTFRPGNDVTVDELVTMTLRAAGYTDESFGDVWLPGAYLKKAKEINALKGLPEQLPEYASKWMAAQAVYNVLEEIEAANRQEETPEQGEEIPAETPESSGMVYLDGAFDENLSSFAGKPIASDVKVYTYGLKKEYKEKMDLPDDPAAYTEVTVYKYKKVSAAIWYELTDGRISKIILPRDVGFSGYAYVVINGTPKTIGADGSAVDALTTLTAGYPITWPLESGVSLPQLRSGEIAELQLRNGEVRSVSFAGNAKGKYFTELTKEAALVKDYSGGVITLSEAGESEKSYSLRSNATIYVLDSDGKYSSERPGSIKKGAKIRLYDVSADRVDEVDLVVVTKQ